MPGCNLAASRSQRFADWSRTKTDVAERGGALVTEFNVESDDAALDSDAQDYRYILR